MLPIILVIAGLGLAIFGYTKYTDSVSGTEIDNLEISARNSETRNQAFILFGLGGGCFVAGLIMFLKPKS